MSLDISLKEDGHEVFCANITHNLGAMAGRAGLYPFLWRPEENDIKFASDLGPLLRLGLIELLEDPTEFEQLDAPNGWGTYADFVPWLMHLYLACRKFPEARVVSDV